MLDQLVISRNQTKERTKFSGYLFSTGVVLVTVLTVGLVISLFNQNIVLAAEGLEISSLIAPVQVEPQPVREMQPQKETSAQTSKSDVPTRKENVLRTEETPFKIPDKISVTPSDVQARPKIPFSLGKIDANPENAGSKTPDTGTSIIGPAKTSNSNADNSRLIEKEEKDNIPPPIVVKKEEKPRTIVSGGVVNGIAKYLAKPSYSGAAKTLGVKGQVKVQVLIDEEGNVISANVVSGHPLLNGSAVSAAKASKFSPTTLSEHKVKVTGFIIYNFA